MILFYKQQLNNLKGPVNHLNNLNNKRNWCIFSHLFQGYSCGLHFGVGTIVNFCINQDLLTRYISFPINSKFSRHCTRNTTATASFCTISTFYGCLENMKKQTNAEYLLHRRYTFGVLQLTQWKLYYIFPKWLKNWQKMQMSKQLSFKNSNIWNINS